jgi:hypothetical protein
MTKLATTVGIELTFMPILFDYLMYYNRKYSDSVEKVIPESNSLCRGMASALEFSLRARKIPFNKCHKDPDCVEVSTKPYITTNALFRTIDKIWKCAADHDLLPTSKYYNGGGAHIHVGVIGACRASAINFTRRMLIFGAQNPWLSWAFVGETDDCNAEPLTLGIITDRDETHNQKDFKDEGYFSLEEIYSLFNIKDYILRSTHYGEQGTVEFRAFEMPELQVTLHKYVYLVDSIVKHVSGQTYTQLRKCDIPTKADIERMPYSKRKAGFHGMLRMLGFDPSDWREETVHMAVSLRHRRQPEDDVEVS